MTMAPVDEKQPRRRKPRTHAPLASHPAVNFRVSTRMWADFGESCRTLGLTRSEALRYFIRWFNNVPNAPKPIRPGDEQPQPQLERRDGAA